MKTEEGIPDYQDIPYHKQRELDQKAYAKYYSDRYEDSGVLTFNSWYGTKYHSEYINILLRKYKLLKIKKNYEKIV